MGYDLMPLGSVCNFQNGRGFKKTEWSTDGIPIIRIQNLNDLAAPYNKFNGTYDKIIEVNDGDLLFSWSGTIGSSFGPHLWNRGKGVLNQHIFKVSLQPDLEKKYAYYALLWVTADVEKQVNGAVGLVHITKSKLKEFQIPCPPLPEQRRIVAILDEAFAGIDAAITNTQRNLANARELFESHLNDIFSQKGEGWVETTVGEQLTLQRGFDITKKQQEPGNVPVVSSGGIKSYHSTAKVNGPGVVIGRKGTLGKAFYLEDDYWPHDTTLWVKDFKGNLPKLIYYFFRGLEVSSLDSGAANPALNRNIVHPIKTAWPSPLVQHDLVKILESLDTETQRLEALYQRKLDALAELKQSILQKAFSGELTAEKAAA